MKDLKIDNFTKRRAEFNGAVDALRNALFLGDINVAAHWFGVLDSAGYFNPESMARHVYKKTIDGYANDVFSRLIELCEKLGLIERGE